MKILVTGGNGFIGSALIKHFANMPETQVVGMVRSSNYISPKADVEFRVGEMVSLNRSFVDMSDIDVVIHTAGRAHILDTQSKGKTDAFRHVNTDATIELAKFAAASGVKRFVFLSSIKVNGENTCLGVPFTINSKENPQCAYGVSKYQAERGLHEVHHKTGLEITIIRIPLVYGPGVKGNLNTLIKIISLGLPLPMASMKSNLRSMIGIDNLLSVISTCTSHPKAKNKTFLVSDNHDISTYTLVRLLGKSIGKKPILIKFPVSLISLIAKLFKKDAEIQKLLSTLQVDISDTCNQLDWKPPLTVSDGFKNSM